MISKIHWLEFTLTSLVFVLICKSVDGQLEGEEEDKNLGILSRKDQKETRLAPITLTTWEHLSNFSREVI